MRLKITLALGKENDKHKQIWSQKRKTLGVYSKRNESSSKENLQME